MANLAKESAISLASGDLKSLLGDTAQLGQNASKDEIPPEMTQLLSELPKWTAERASALDRIKQAYDEDPRMKMSAAQAHGRAMFNNPNIHDMGYSLAAGSKARDEQEAFLRDSKVAREKAVLDALDLGTFDKLYSTVQKNLKDSKDKRQMIGSADQGWWAYNFDTGEKKLLVPGVLQQKQQAQLREVILNRLKEDGGDMTAHTKNADKLAQQIIYKYTPEEVEQYINEGGIQGAVTHGVATEPDQPVSTITNGGVPYQRQSALADIAATEDPEGRLSVAQSQVGESQGQLAARLKAAGIVDPGVPNKVGLKPIGIGPLITKTPQQLANEKAMGEGEYKVYEDYKERLSSLNNANQQIAAMEGMLESDKLNSGMFHEEINKVGGFVNYIDPKNQLAQNAGNDAAYYSKMMDLVRDKIKALGAGTAVSNLDLIVTQKSVGDLRNTPQGNLKVMALMKLANATMSDIMNEKVGYYDSKGNTFQGYKRDTTPTHALKYRLLPTGNWAFDVEDKASWIERARVANGGKLPPDINARWKTYADNSVKNLADPDKLLKKGK